ncbi:MAG: GNAT family N-acetyltransferase [Firmicutes bacterium]|nr:GNAT family N-acetyltransferase [Bacillota bacterium]
MDRSDFLKEQDLFVLQPLESHQVSAAADLVLGNHVFNRYNYNKEILEGLLLKGLEQKDVILAACEGDEIRGFVWMQKQAVFGLSDYIRLIVVEAGQHGRGIGQFLMMAVEVIAQESGPNLFILTSMDNLAAQKFYLRLGYEHIGTIKNYVIDGIDELLLRKTWGSIR